MASCIFCVAPRSPMSGSQEVAHHSCRNAAAHRARSKLTQVHGPQMTQDLISWGKFNLQILWDMMWFYTFSFSVENQGFLWKRAQAAACLQRKDVVGIFLINVKYWYPNQKCNRNVKYCIYHHPCIKFPTNAEQTHKIYSSYSFHSMDLMY